MKIGIIYPTLNGQ